MTEKKEEKVVTEWKGIMVAELQEMLKKESNFYISNYLGLKADEVNELRRRLEPLSSKYLILKNSLARMALKNAGFEELNKFINGGVGMAFGGSNPIQTAKAMSKFSKSHQALQFKGGYFEGKIIDADKIKYIASLPAREELIAKVVYTIKAPISSMVNVLGNTLRSLVYAIQAIKGKREEGG